MKFPSQYTNKYFDLSTTVQFALWFTLILLIKYDTLLKPPVWDTAMGIFPPAIFLSEHNFDIALLISQPGWWDGGPNVHSLSLWTWFVALVMFISKHSTATFLIVHSVTFALTAYAIMLLVKTTRELGVYSYLALLSGLLLLLTPLVLVQVGYMYTEILVMALSICAWVSWRGGQEGRAVAYTIIAISIKLTGLIIGLCLLPLLILRLIKQFTFKRLVMIILIPLSYVVVSYLYDWLGGVAITPERPWGGFEGILGSMLNRIKFAADIQILFVVSTCAAILYSALKWISLRRLNPFPHLYRYCIADGTITIVICYSFLFCLGVIAMAYLGNLFLLRYAAPIIPFLVLQLVISGQALRVQPVVAIIFVGVCLFSIYNQNGKTYERSEFFSVVESSHAYKKFILAQKEIIEQIAQLDDKTPIYVSREIDYMTSHPMMGYLDKKKPNIIGIYQQEFAELTIDQLPSEFYVARTNTLDIHGGGKIAWILNSALQAEDRGWRASNIFWHKIDGRLMTLDHIYKEIHDIN